MNNNRIKPLMQYQFVTKSDCPIMILKKQVEKGSHYLEWARKSGKLWGGIESAQIGPSGPSVTVGAAMIAKTCQVEIRFILNF